MYDADEEESIEPEAENPVETVGTDWLENTEDRSAEVLSVRKALVAGL